MDFGPVSTERAAGAVLAHSLQAKGVRLKKGHVLTGDDVSALKKAGVAEVTVARLGMKDVPENAAALELASALVAPNLRLSEPVAGRVNLIATAAGVLTLDAVALAAFNGIDESITVATLGNGARVAAGALVATVKVIPYAAPAGHVASAVAALAANTLVLHPFTGRSARLILTRTPEMKESLLDKGASVVRRRLSGVQVHLSDVTTCDHTTSAVAEAITKGKGQMQLILGASATSDRRDVVPGALVAAGGDILRFGMPVDPGNLLFLGRLDDQAVLGLPGCARSPALNGADWVLERLAAGIDVSAEDIAAMGVGGLLKEVPARGQPRRARAANAAPGQVHVLLLAAGRSRRMRGAHKLLRTVDGQPLVRRTLDRLAASGLPVHVVVDPANTDLAAALDGCKHPLVHAEQAAQGLAASLRAGIAALPSDASAVIVALADMPDVTADHLKQLVNAYDPANGAWIVAPVAPNGKRGNPVLFDRRYFEALMALSGDVGAKSLLDEDHGAMRLVETDASVLTDLDTPEAWAEWEAARARS